MELNDEIHLAVPREVAVVGDPQAEATKAMLSSLALPFRPEIVTAFSAPQDAERAAREVPLLQGRAASSGVAQTPTAWVCRDMACNLPVHTAAELEAQLAQD